MAEAYNSVDAIVAAAVRSGADLVHPGGGALAENPNLPACLALEGIGVVGPPAAALAVANDKGRTASAACRLGIPVLPHATTGEGLDALVAQVGLPIVVKPVDGCLGAGVRVVRTTAELEEELATYADARGWYAERYVEKGRVVAITVAVDADGMSAELGERETLLLAGSFKLLDASPVLTVPPVLVARMRDDARRLAIGLGLTGVATCEFIVGRAGYFLLEINPRLAGGFRMCEAQSGLDVLSLQFRIADGQTVSSGSVVLDRELHCLEARWYRRPEARRTGTFERLRFAPVPGVSYDWAIQEDRSLAFDTIVAQLLATGPGRRVAAGRLLQASAAAESRGLPHYGDRIAGWLRAAEFHDVLYASVPVRG